jgi:hypothetical protein
LTALAGGADVISDYNDNGQIDGCYTLDEYDAAVGLLGEDDPQYGETFDAIQDARLANVVAEQGQPCPEGTAPATGDAPEVDEGGGNGALLAVVLVVAAIAAVGAGALVRLRSPR